MRLRPNDMSAVTVEATGITIGGNQRRRRIDPRATSDGRVVVTASATNVQRTMPEDQEERVLVQLRLEDAAEDDPQDGEIE